MRSFSLRKVPTIWLHVKFFVQTKPEIHLKQAPLRPLTMSER